MAPGVPLVAAWPLRLPLVGTFVATANAIAAVGISIGGNATTFQDATGCECVGGERGTAESKDDCKKSHALAQHELGSHHELPFVSGRAYQKANGPSIAHGSKMGELGPFSGQ